MLSQIIKMENKIFKNLDSDSQDNNSEKNDEKLNHKLKKKVNNLL